MHDIQPKSQLKRQDCGYHNFSTECATIVDTRNTKIDNEFNKMNTINSPQDLVFLVVHRFLGHQPFHVLLQFLSVPCIRAILCLLWHQRLLVLLLHLYFLGLQRNHGRQWHQHYRFLLLYPTTIQKTNCS